MRTVHATGSGDDAVLEVVLTVVHDAGDADRDTATVVTADRGLRTRVEGAGATTLGPSWLLGRLPEG